VQRELIKAVDDNFTSDKFDSIALFADGLDVHPYWIERRDDNALANVNNTQVEDYISWMKHAHKGTPALAGGLYAEYAVYLVATTTTPWVPSIDDYEDAWEAATTATENPTLSYVDAAEHARARYFGITGADPVGSIALTDPSWTPVRWNNSDRPESLKAREARERQRIAERIGTGTYQAGGGASYRDW
jgi:hypothetical protein